MFVSRLLYIVSWIAAVLLLVNSVAAFFYIENIPATLGRNIYSFTSALGIVAGLFFLAVAVMRVINPRN